MKKPVDESVCTGKNWRHSEKRKKLPSPLPRKRSHTRPWIFTVVFISPAQAAALIPLLILVQKVVL